MNTVHRSLAAVALAASTMISFTACGSSGGSSGGTTAPADQNKIFQFESAGFSSPKSMTIKLPQGLLDAMGSQQGLMVTSYEATVRDLPGAEYCAIDVKMNYAAGGQELVGKPVLSIRTPDQAAAVEKRAVQGAVDAAMKGARAKGYTGTSVNEGLTKAYGPASSGLWTFTHSSGSDTVTELNNENAFKDWAGTYEEAIAKINQRIDDNAAKANAELNGIPAVTNVANRLLDDSKGKPASQMPATPTESRAYVADDLTSGTVVKGCASQPFDKDTDAELTFPIVVDGKEKTLAKVYVTVMKGGDITVRDAKVEGYKFGSDGRWIKK